MLVRSGRSLERISVATRFSAFVLLLVNALGLDAPFELSAAVWFESEGASAKRALWELGEAGLWARPTCAAAGLTIGPEAGWLGEPLS